MAKSAAARQFVLLPQRGMVARAVTANPALTSFLLSLHSQVGAAALDVVPASPSSSASRRKRHNVNLRVLGSIHEDGAKLIEMSPQAVSDLRTEMPGMRILPVVYYFPAITPRPTPASGPQAAAKAASTKITVKVVSQKSGSPVAGAMV